MRKGSRVHDFLAALEEAAYEREDDPAEAAGLRELVNSLSSGKLLNLSYVDEKQREDVAIAKLDQLIELVVSIRTAWIASPKSKHARQIAGRRLGPLEGEMSDSESKVATNQLLSSMSPEKSAEYNFCFRATGSSKFFFVLLRQPSFLKAKDLDKLLKEWANIRNSSEYKEAIENRTKRKEPEAKQKAELQKLRVEINRLRKQGRNAKDLLLKLQAKKKRYEDHKKRSLGQTPSRSDDSPPEPNRTPPTSYCIFNWKHQITKELDVDWTVCPEDWSEELRLRELRNEMIKEQLQLGRPVIYRSSGWSLHPRVSSNDQCTYEPVTSANEVTQDDIVFCQVKPGNRFYAHLVARKWFKHGEWYFTITNLKGRENGWCSIKHIYGRLIRCEH